MDGIFRKAVGPVALLAGLGIGATAMDVARDPVTDLNAQSASVAPGPESLAVSFRAASRVALPAVVRVDVATAPIAAGRMVPNDGRDAPGAQIPGAPPLQRGPRSGSGSGFIISQDGYVLTNNHVVAGATRVTVTLTDRREFRAKVVGRDPNTDVAVLKVDAEGLPTVRLAASDQVQVGDWVLALGYPLTLGETVTAGIVSAKGRSLGIVGQNQGAVAPLEHFIQTDAAINPGNSGGPLIDLRGEVVGINTAIASTTGSYAGYGFSVPIRLARRVADDLIRYGTVRRPRIGVQIRDVTPADVEVFGLESARGAVVATVPEGPARAAGVELGDVIVAVDGAPVQDTGDLMERIALRQPGDRVRLELRRYGRRAEAGVRLDAFEAEPTARAAAPEATEESAARLGLAVAPVDPSLARRFGVAGTTDGLIVTEVDPMGPAPRSLIGMRIDRVNGRPVGTAEDLRRIVGGLRPGATVSIVGRLPDGNSTIVNYRLQG